MTELYHHGIKGMKWGVRHTPEELGHKRAIKAKGRLSKYKDKKIVRINKMYAKAISKTKEGLDYDPGNKELIKQLSDLEKLKARDIDKINSMSYTDVVREQKETRDRRIKTAIKVGAATASTVGATTLWAAKMGLVGVRIYGTFKAAQIVGELGKEAITWLNSPEGQELINKGMKSVNTFIKAGDTVAKIANPDIAQYVDSEKLAEFAFNTGKTYVEAELRKRTVS